MFDILDEMYELVYVMDINTYDLLYLNSAGKKTFGIPQETAGQKCYRLIQGREAPCPFCPNSHLKDGQVYSWEITNPVVGRHYQLKDQLTDWNGIPAKVEIAFDITDNENEKNALKRKLEVEDLLMRCVRRLYLLHDLEEEISCILEEIGTFLKAERTYIFEMRNHKMYNTYEWCAPGTEPQKNRLQELDEALIDCWKPCFLRHESYIMEDIETIRRTFPATYQVLADQNIRSLVAVPLEQDGRLAGYIGVDNPSKETLGDISLIFNTLQYFLMATIRRISDEKRLTRLSYYDPLTGAYNRNRYIKDSQALRSLDCPVGIVYMDINGLKDINDHMGHSSGDSVLLNTVQLVSHVFDGGQLYRIGGDEFVVLCRGCSREYLHERVLHLKKLMEANPECSAAIGYHWTENSATIEQSVSLADAMMYEDKKSHYRGIQAPRRYRHYNDALLSLNDPDVLQRELDAGHFLIYLQPKISFQDRSLSGAEALIRYRPAGGEIIAPYQILPQLEEMHLISLIDFYVFDAICKRISQWNQKGIRPIPVSVNFSRDTISGISFLSRLEAICRKYGVDKKYLEIEITESTESMKDFDLKSFTMKLHEAGFLISIDDFGVHYANLSLLSTVQFDKLKIDKSLIDTLQTNVKTQLIVNALAAMCKGMEIGTTVEGVETEEQFRLLKEMGFQEAQGFLFSRPIPAEEFEKVYQ